MIIPTIGRIMWYWPDKQYRGKLPWAAIVTDVHSDNMVSLAVFASNGDTILGGKRSVPVVQDGSPNIAGDSPYVEWMPYQVGQAKKDKING